MDGSRFWVVLSLLLLAISTCAVEYLPGPISDSMKWPVPEEPYQAAARIWARKHGRPSDKCVEQARTTRYRILDEASLAHACRRKEAPSACMESFSYDLENGAIVNLADNPRGLSYSIRVHELLHVLMWCAGTGKSDGDLHKDGVWSLVPPDELPPESPWSRSPTSRSLDLDGDSASICNQPVP
jgi:hypothetical protein